MGRVIRVAISRSLIFVFACFIAGLLAGPTEAEAPADANPARRLAAMLDQYRNKEILTIRGADLIGAYGASLIPFAEVYVSDSSKLVRWQACALLWQLGTRESEGTPERRKVVELLVRTLDDPEALVWQKAAQWLLSFTEPDFSEPSKQFVRALLRKYQQERLPELVLVVGVANMHSELTFLNGLLGGEGSSGRGGGWYGSKSWAARRARARMGVREDIQRCIEMVEAEPDKIVRYGTLFDHLQYLRQSQAVSVLVRYLNRNEPSQYRSPDASLLPARYLAAAALGQMLRGFPVKKEASLYHKEDILVCRKWMALQKKWDIIR